jgi:hypothetical protein
MASLECPHKSNAQSGPLSLLSFALRPDDSCGLSRRSSRGDEGQEDPQRGKGDWILAMRSKPGNKTRVGYCRTDSGIISFMRH